MSRRFVPKLIPSCLILCFLIAVAGSASAYEYRVPIFIQDETDIEELYYSQDISLDERDRLLELLESPLDLNSADRDDLYNLPGVTYSMVDRIIARRATRPFEDTEELLKIDGISPDIYRQVEPFVQVITIQKPKEKVPWKGKVRIQAIDHANDSDSDFPEAYTRVQIKRGRNLEFGAMVLTQNTVVTPEFVSVPDTLPATAEWKFDQDGNPKVNPDGFSPAQTDEHRRYLRTDGETYLPAMPKVYALYAMDDIGWGKARVRMLAGSYRIGFGQRIVFDNSGRKNPFGFRPDLVTYQSEDGYTAFRGLFGAAATLSEMPVASVMSLDATAFFSWWQYDIYQPDLRHENNELLVQMGEDENESYVLLTPYKEYPQGSGQTYYKRISYQTLPRAYNELLGGGNVTMRFGPDLHWGFTGYAANITFNLGDSGTIFSRSAKFPNRSVFWAVGSDFAWTRGWFNLFAEFGTMDNLSPAGIVMALADFDDLRLEASYRYYSDDFDNPHSRASAMGDEFDGDRDRGEHGVMLSAVYRPIKMLAFRLDQDIWQTTRWEDTDLLEDKNRPWRLETFLRADLTPLRWLRVGAFVQYNDKDLAVSGRERTYVEDGEKVQFGFQTAVSLPLNSRIWAYYKLPMYDAKLGDSFQRDHYATIKFTTRPIQLLRVSGRFKYLKGELEQLQGSSREHYYEGYLEAGFYVTKDLVLTARGMYRDYFEGDYEHEIFWRAGAEWKF